MSSRENISYPYSLYIHTPPVVHTPPRIYTIIIWIYLYYYSIAITMPKLIETYSKDNLNLRVCFCWVNSGIGGDGPEAGGCGGGKAVSITEPIFGSRLLVANMRYILAYLPRDGRLGRKSISQAYLPSIGRPNGQFNTQAYIVMY